MTKIIDLFNFQVFVKKSKEMCPFPSMDALTKTFIKNILFIAVMLGFVLFFTCAYLVWNLIVMLRRQGFSRRHSSPDGGEVGGSSDKREQNSPDCGRSRISCSSSSFILTPTQTPTASSSEKRFFESSHHQEESEEQNLSDHENRSGISCPIFSSIQIPAPSSTMTSSNENLGFSNQENNNGEQIEQRSSPEKNNQFQKMDSTSPAYLTQTSSNTDISFSVTNEGYEEHEEMKLPECNRSKRIVSFSSDSPFLLNPPIPTTSSTHCKCILFSLFFPEKKS